MTPAPPARHNASIGYEHRVEITARRGIQHRVNGILRNPLPVRCVPAQSFRVLQPRDVHIAEPLRWDVGLVTRGELALILRGDVNAVGRREAPSCRRVAPTGANYEGGDETAECEESETEREFEA